MPGAYFSTSSSKPLSFTRRTDRSRSGPPDHSRPARGEIARGEIEKPSAPGEEMVDKLNEIAKKRPFCSYIKSRKYDPL
jgi:hypothetical protein